MLKIGSAGMAGIEYRTQMSMWSMMAAPLESSGPGLRSASAQTMAILGSKQIIAVDQDRLGAHKDHWNTCGLMVLDKPLPNGDHAIAPYNSTGTLATVSVPASATGLRRAGWYTAYRTCGASASLMPGRSSRRLTPMPRRGTPRPDSRSSRRSALSNHPPASLSTA